MLRLQLVWKPNSAYEHWIYGMAHYGLCDYKAAIQSLEKAKELYPSNPVYEQYANAAEAGCEPWIPASIKAIFLMFKQCNAKRNDPRYLGESNETKGVEASRRKLLLT